MKFPQLFLGLVVAGFGFAAPTRAQILADFAADYQPGTLDTVMSPLADSHGTGNWTYNLAFVNNDAAPTGFGGKEALTYEANGDGGSGSTLYGTTSGNSYNVIELPAVSNGNIFPDSPNLPADFLSVHPGGDTAATLVQWTAGTDETGTLTLSFDLSRQNVGTAGVGPGQGYDDFTVYRGNTLIYSDYAMYAGTDTGLQTLTLTGVTAGTTLSFVTSSTNGVLGYNLSFLKADISAVPEPSTWAMLMGGVVMAASLIRRRGVRV